jgi:hypothetical protein
MQHLNQLAGCACRMAHGSSSGRSKRLTAIVWPTCFTG